MGFGDMTVEGVTLGRAKKMGKDVSLEMSVLYYILHVVLHSALSLLCKLFIEIVCNAYTFALCVCSSTICA